MQIARQERNEFAFAAGKEPEAGINTGDYSPQQISQTADSSGGETDSPRRT